MKAVVNTRATRSAVQQVTTNTTSWIGHQPLDHKNIIGGQTFMVPVAADLEAIEVFTSMVTTPGKVQLTLYSFDSQLQSWGSVLGSADADVTLSDNGKWKVFPINGLHLEKGNSYGFKLESNSFIGMGETAGCSQAPPLLNGKEWKFTNHEPNGDCYAYFSLAFKVDVRA